MRAPSFDLADILADAGVGTQKATAGWGIYVSRLPDSPDTVVALFDSGGPRPLLNSPIDLPTVQVKVRGTVNGYDAAYVKALEVRDQLHGIARRDVGDTHYMLIAAYSDPSLVEYDENQRPIVACNFAIHRRGPAGPWR